MELKRRKTQIRIMCRTVDNFFKKYFEAKLDKQP